MAQLIAQIHYGLLLEHNGTGSSFGNILYSINGKKWYQSDSTGASFSSEGTGVAYGTSDSTNPLWVAVGQTSGSSFGNILYSSNGKTWTQSESSGASFGNFGHNVAYGTSDGVSPLWVAVGKTSGSTF